MQFFRMHHILFMVNMKSSYVWTTGHTVERIVVPHRTTVLHEYRHTTMKKYSINLYTTNLLTDFDYTYAIYKNMLPIHQLKNTNCITVQMLRKYCTCANRTSRVKQLAGEECKIVFSA